MIFSYTKYPIDEALSNISGQPFIYRPFIPLEISYISNRYQLTALLDTGADYTVGPLELAEALEIDFKNKPSVYMGGVGDGRIETKFANVTLRVGGRVIQTYMGFGNYPLVLLGQAGFFEKMKEVKFSYPDNFNLKF